MHSVMTTLHRVQYWLEHYTHTAYFSPPPACHWERKSNGETPKISIKILYEYGSWSKGLGWQKESDRSNERVEKWNTEKRNPYLVPEKEIRLTELKLFNVELLHERKSHHIEARKNPTPPYKWGKGGKRVRHCQGVLSVFISCLFLSSVFRVMIQSHSEQLWQAVSMGF